MRDTAPLNRPERLIGEYHTARPGPLLIVLAGIHGNEPSGVVAVGRLLEQLREHAIPLRGRVVALHGNMMALQYGRRFIRCDLNRIWKTERIERLRAMTEASSLEDEERELFELLGIIEGLLDGEEIPAILVDLHSTSGVAPPFSIISDTLQNRKIAFSIPVPVVLGLEEAIDGTTLSYFGEMGLTAVGIEGGKHENPETIDNHEACLWMMLAGADMLDQNMIPDFKRHRNVLRSATGVLPRVVEIIHRHGIEEQDEMTMIEGYRNFDLVSANEVLARDRSGEVKSPVQGMLLLPRYQALGDDGFFISRPVNPFWLQLSSLFRFLRLDLILQFFPGVHHDGSGRRILLADPRIARWFTIQIFHLLGYRKRGIENGMMKFSRRAEKPTF